ncbi:MAG: TonB-dependent receptor [Acidaminococcaceae bacterium]
MKSCTINKGLLMTMLLTGVIVNANLVNAATAPLEKFTLDTMLVTAQRTETRDLDTPATTTVITEEAIREAGYKNVFDAIENQVGMTSTGYGDGGQDFGFSSGRTVIRGYDRGTLVMLNGIPLNLKNYNSLDGIPLEMVARIEIIKGAAGTLYGAEAMGGVINIITKKSALKNTNIKQNTLRGTIGNYYKDYNLTLAGERFIVSAGKEYSNKYDNANDYPKGSNTDWWNGQGQKSRLALTSQLTDEINFDLFYQEGDITRGGHKAKKQYNYRYDDKRLTTGLSYAGKANGVKAILGYNYRQADGFDFVKKEQVNSAADLASYIADVQKTWQIADDTLITGYTFKRENYENLKTVKNKAHRTNNALYTSYNHVFSDKFSATLGLRYEHIADAAKDQQVFNPQVQTLYKINEETSWYTNIGKAFQMPAVDAYFDKSVTGGATATLKPEEGWTYETGIKKVMGDQSWKVALYHMKFENKLGWSNKNDEPDQISKPINKGDFRNTGIEGEYTKKLDKNWKYTLGIGYGNPEIKDPSQKQAIWIQDAGRVDLLASLTYSKDKVISNLSYKYLGDREYYSGHDVPSRNRLTWHTSYQMTKDDKISLTINNLLDSTNYANRYGNLELPLNWRISYLHSF